MLFLIHIRDSIALRFEPFKRMYETIRKAGDLVGRRFELEDP